MATQRYSVTPQPIDTLLAWVKSGEIAIPEIQRPFVWEPVKVRNLLDSLYRGFPMGYLILSGLQVRQRGARGGALYAALDERQAGHVQVRARRRVHPGAPDPAQDGARPHRQDQR